MGSTAAANCFAAVLIQSENLSNSFLNPANDRTCEQVNAAGYLRYPEDRVLRIRPAPPELENSNSGSCRWRCRLSVRYYLSPKIFRRLRVTLLAIAILWMTPALSRSQKRGAPAGARGEAYEKCRSFFSGSAKELADSEENNTFLGSCGWQFFDYHELPEATEAFDRSMEMAQRRHDRARLASALEGIGGIHRERGAFEQAERLLQQALALADELHDQQELTRLYNSFARLYGEQGKEEKGYEYLLRSLKLSQELNNPLRIAVANNNLGTHFKAQGDILRALDYFNQSLTGLQQMNDEIRSATVLDNIGLCYDYLGDYPKAIESIRNGLAIREKFKDTHGIAKSLDSLGNLQVELGNYSAALRMLQKGLELRRAGGLPYPVAESLNNIGTVYEAQGEYAQATAYLRKALVLAKTLNKWLETEVDTNLGEVYFLQGNYPKALAALNQALENGQAAKANVKIAFVQNALGRLYLKLGQFREAEGVLYAARQLFESAGMPPELASTLIELAELERHRGHIQESLDFATRARDLGDRMGLLDIQWRALTTLGRLNAAQGKRAEAAKSFDDAIMAVESLRTRVAGGEETRSRFFADKVAPYQERIALALAGGKTDDALYYAERSKARVLVDTIGADRVPLITAMTADEKKRELNLRHSLASLNSQIRVEGQANPPNEKRLTSLRQQCEAARLQYEDFQSTLYAAHLELRVSRGAIPVVRATETAGLVPGRSAAILEFAVVGDRMWAFAIGPQGVRAAELAMNNKELGYEVEYFRQQLAARDLRIGARARRLFEQVLGPVRSVVTEKTELVIIPDGPLWDLPFQALQSGPEHYLIEDSAISYAPSLTALREMTAPRPAVKNQPTLLAFGNPAISARAPDRAPAVLADKGLGPLPEAEIQAKTIGELYRPESQVYVGAEAREDRWKAEAQSYRVLHLATHGVLDNRSPLYSYLMLSPSDDPKNPEDGFLEAWEIMRMRLNADLVVLSACETARGKIFAGEAVIGLTWAFFVAGSPATLVSQWSVESASSGALMVDFHKMWNAGRNGVSKARALQLAAVQMRHSTHYSHPFYWGGYVLIGNAR